MSEPRPSPKSPARPSVRLPLQSGATALKELLFAQFGALFLVAGIETMIELGFTVFSALIGAVVLFVLLARARQRRASDVLFDADHLSVEAGFRSGLLVPWSHVASCRIDESVKEWVRVDGVKTPLRSLVLTRKDGSEIVLAESLDVEEQRSMAAVETAVSAKLGAMPAVPTAGPAGVDVVTCPTCGGLTAPTDEESVRCPYCRTVVPMPPDVRARIARSRDADAARRDLERGVANLLVQPGAHRTNRLIFAFALSSLLVGPVVASVEMSRRNSLEAAVPVVAALLICWAIAHTAVADRVALRALLIGFGARARDDAVPYACRICGGALPEAPDGTSLVRCAYCGADNVLGLDWLPVTRELIAEEVDVEQAVAARKHARGLRNMVLGGAIAVASFTTWDVYRQPPPRTVAPQFNYAGLRAPEVRADASKLSTTAAARRATRVTPVGFDASRPAPAPDGRSLFFEHVEGGHGAIFAASSPPDATPTSVLFGAGGPAWLPSGTGFLFTRFAGIAREELLLAQEPSGAGERRVAVVDGIMVRASVAPDGDHVVWDDKQGLRFARLSGGPSTTVPDWFEPSYSPVELLVAAVARTGNHLAILDGAGPRVREDVVLPLHPEGPAWSPDGLSIAFIGRARAGAPGGDLWTVDLRGGDPVKLTSGGALAAPVAWAPDGAILVTAGAEGRRSIWSVERATTQPANGSPARGGAKR